MSGSQWIAQLTMQTGARFNFALWQTDSGHVPTVIQMIQDVLRTGGVDGIRYLDDHREPIPFQVATYEDFTSYGLALTQAANYELVRSLYGSLIVNVGGVIQNISPIKVTKVAGLDGLSPKPAAGIMAGFGATPGSAAYLTALWSMHYAYP